VIVEPKSRPRNWLLRYVLEQYSDTMDTMDVDAIANIALSSI